MYISRLIVKELMNIFANAEYKLLFSVMKDNLIFYLFKNEKNIK